MTRMALNPERQTAISNPGSPTVRMRFVRLSGGVIAVKEIKAELARREYQTLQLLHRIDQPAVEPLAVIAGRTDVDGNELDACLVTRHLKFSLPYRAIFSQRLRPDTARRVLDALAGRRAHIRQVVEHA